MWRRRVPKVQTVQQTVEILQVLLEICGYRRDSTVAVLGSTKLSVSQGLPKEASGRISFSACCSRCSLGNLDIISSSSLYLAATCTRALRQSTEALGRNTFVFYLKVDPDPEVDSPGAVRTRKIRTLFPRAAHMAEVMAVWRLMVLFSAFLLGLLEFFRAFDGQQLLAIEGLLAQLDRSESSTWTFLRSPSSETTTIIQSGEAPF